MQIKPNSTLVEGLVRAVRPHPEGWGSEVELEVLDNLSPEPAADFLQPAPGTRIQVLYSQPAPLAVGQKVRAGLTVHGGPGGERAVIQSVETIAEGARS
jgi:hypothetical protein